MNSLLFADPLFLFFFAPIVLTFYYIIPSRFRNAFLLFASLGFYAWGEGRYTLVLLASATLNYLWGIRIDRLEVPDKRRAVLWVGVMLNVLLLGVFKYLAFVVANFNVLGTALQFRPIPVPTIHLPVGISFFTFMGLSYLIDVYRRQFDAETRPVLFGVYLALFPHLIAGPIVRYSSIAAELRSRRIRLDDIAAGITRFVVGLGKKLLIANTVATVVDKVFTLPANQLTPSLAWLGIICYTLQIYYDFSGYSDMAIGLARMLGFTFPENFKYPYTARSITEFWSRWHISFSTWLRDYLFFPLGVRRGRLRLYGNLLVVFLVCGLWHGASWRFVIWGLFHGSFVILERAGMANRLSRLPSVVRHGYALLVVMAGWVLFRAETLSYAVAYLASLAGRSHYGPLVAGVAVALTPQVVSAIVGGILGSAPVLPAIERLIARTATESASPIASVLQMGVGVARVAGTVATFIMSAAFSAAGTYNPFIYFRF
jgi:alginate O-acetyltransferase complex protein AlgI